MESQWCNVPTSFIFFWSCLSSSHGPYLHTCIIAVIFLQHSWHSPFYVMLELSLAYPRQPWSASCASSQTLCHDFLSQVQRHLSKLFDNMAKMQFQLDASQNPTKTSLGMYSKEEEYVAFSEPCDCSGQVSYSLFLSSYFAHPLLLKPNSWTSVSSSQSLWPGKETFLD